MNVSIKKTFLMRPLGGLLILLAVLTGCRKETGEPGTAMASGSGGSAMAPPVDVVTVKLESVLWDRSYPGRTEGMRLVTIRPRVGGVITERAYTEGKKVSAGDILFQIDPEPYEAVVAQAKAQLQRAEAALRQAERDKVRADRLYETDAVSERQRDDAQSAFELATAEVALAEAALSDAQLRLDYTTVRSPINGVTSLEMLPEGSLVNAGEPLTTVTQLDPMYVLFSLPEGDPAYTLFMSSQDSRTYDLSLERRNNGHYQEKGKINFTETRVDENTGTVRVRASFPNPEDLLLPGQFVRIGFDDMHLPEAAIIPPEAVLMTDMGSMVYVLGEGNAVTPRPVVLGPVLDGGQLVMGGLQSGERVICSSLIRIRPGMPVTPVEKGAASKEQE